jgi:hypothetical protein
MRNLFLFVCLTMTGLAYGQFGLQLNHNFNQFGLSNVDDVLPAPDNLAYSSGEVSVHYWFRLPEQRIEFQPTVYYGTSYGDEDHAEYGAQFKVNIYPFDLGTDCACPTFGKQGPQLEKGFFIQLAPGYASQRLFEQERVNRFTLAGGVGLDFGVSNLLTLTPIAAARLYTGSGPDFVIRDDSGQPLQNVDGDLITYQIGLQATFRLDKRRY